MRINKKETIRFVLLINIKREKQKHTNHYKNILL
jgi:hypothetical protein